MNSKRDIDKEKLNRNESPPISRRSSVRTDNGVVDQIEYNRSEPISRTSSMMINQHNENDLKALKQMTATAFKKKKLMSQKIDTTKAESQKRSSLLGSRKNSANLSVYIILLFINRDYHHIIVICHWIVKLHFQKWVYHQLQQIQGLN